jgi:hypothetical protein
LKNQTNMMLDNKVGSLFKDLIRSATAIKYSMCLSFCYCILYIYVMSLFAECISWIIISLVQVGLVFGSVASFHKYKLVQDSTHY